jgi:hypothetical protein
LLRCKERIFPTPEDFYEVTFDDLSSDGFSFYVDKDFDCERLVAKLGAAPNVVPVLARVVRQDRVMRDEKSVWLIGCEILQRINNQTPRHVESVNDCDVRAQLGVAV